MSHYRLVVFLLITLLLLACSGNMAATDLTRQQWRLIEINGQSPLATGQPLTITFDTTNRVSGFSGCNNFSGSYRLEGSDLTIGEVATTLMACADNAVTDQEMAFHQALRSVVRYELNAGELTLFAGNGEAVLRFQPA